MRASNREVQTSGGSLQRFRRWAPIVATCVLLSAYSCKDGSPAPMISLTWRDKIDHFSVYGLLALLVFQALPTSLQGVKRWLCAFSLVSAFGLWDETLQFFNPARTGDPLDWLADSLGALAAVVTCSAIPNIQKLANWSPFAFFSKTKKACRDFSTTGQSGV